MARKITLFSYESAKKAMDEAPDRAVVDFLKAQKPCRALFIKAAAGAHIAGKLGFEVTVVDSDLAAINASRAKGELRHEYSDFFSFAKRTPKDSFETVIDNTYSNSLRRRELWKFYREVSKLLRHNSLLFTKAFSTADAYCREHCPRRNWTHVGNDYINFFTKTSLANAIRRGGFDIRSHSGRTDLDRTYHIVVSQQRLMKL